MRMIGVNHRGSSSRVVTTPQAVVASVVGALLSM
jgi:hypothetical protein